MKENEAERLRSMWIIENEINKRGFEFIAGVDEAGRGPLAGDVYAAAVILPRGICIEGLNDSKKISAQKRELLYDEIIKAALSYSVAAASVEEINEINIRNATYLAMNRALNSLSLSPDYVIVDGDCIKECSFPYECIIKGDSKSSSIAAASILAKVTRDRYMLEAEKKYPGYEFASHKGYGTKVHIQKLKELGPCEIHRKTFIKKFV